MGKWSEKILDLIYPSLNLCVSCYEKIGDNFICHECMRDIKFNEDLNKFEFKDFKAYNACYYFGTIKNIIYNFKIYKDFRSGEYLSSILNFYIKKLDIKIDYLTYVPRDKNKIKKEGFDQSYYLVKKLSESLNIPYVRLLYCNGKKCDQKKLDIYGRSVNIKDKFFINKGVDLNKFNGKKVLIIDDVATTYNTLNEVCRIIKKSVFETDLSVLTIAKTLI